MQHTARSTVLNIKGIGEGLPLGLVHSGAHRRHDTSFLLVNCYHWYWNDHRMMHRSLARRSKSRSSIFIQYIVVNVHFPEHKSDRSLSFWHSIDPPIVVYETSSGPSIAEHQLRSDRSAPHPWTLKDKDVFQENWHQIVHLLLFERDKLPLVLALSNVNVSVELFNSRTSSFICNDWFC